MGTARGEMLAGVGHAPGTTMRVIRRRRICKEG